MKYVFIVNPISGKGRSHEFVPYIDEYCRENGLDFKMITTEYPKHATEIASGITDTDTTIISVGGDGTSKEILDGLNEGVKLCILPAGTGNDFFKSVDLRKLEIKTLIREIMEGEYIEIDMGLINGQSRFINVGSFGLDADINVYACDVVKVKYNIPGDLVYAYSALKVGLHPTPFKARITIDDGEPFEENVILTAICSGRHYGGMFLPCPDADLSDGIFNLCVVRGPVSLFTLLNLIMKYSKGKHVGHEKIAMYSGKKFRFEFEKEVNAQIDGENTKYTNADIELLHRKISLLVPRNRQSDR